jgi:hypothetical protein
MESVVFDFKSTSKVCSRCKKTKPLSFFHKDASCKDGHTRACKECISAWSKAVYRANPQKVLTKNAAWYRSNPEKGKAYQRKYQSVHRDKLRKQKEARQAVRNAVRSGKLPPVKTLKCIRCGNQARDYHHHKGYAEKHQLDVIPVCRPCHRIIDRANERNYLP